MLADTGLAPLLDAVVTSAELGVAKPDPAIFVRGLELAGVAADEAVHVGDSAELDIAGAGGAGIEALLVQRDGVESPAAGVRTIHSLRELPGLGPGDAPPTL